MACINYSRIAKQTTADWVFVFKWIISDLEVEQVLCKLREQLGQVVWSFAVTHDFAHTIQIGWFSILPEFLVQ